MNEYLQSFMDTNAQVLQTTQALRAAAQQQRQFEQTKQLQEREQALREREFTNTQQQQGFERGRQGFGDLLAALANGGQAVSPEGTVHQDSDIPRFRADQQGNLAPAGAGVTVPVPDRGRIATPAGGSQGFYMPTQEEQAARDLREKVRQASAVNEANTVGLPDQMAQYAGFAPGARIPQAGFDTMLGRYLASKEATDRAREKPVPEAKLVPHFVSDDAGNVSAFSFDPTSGQAKPAGRFPGAGPQRKDPNAPAAAKQASPAQLNAIENRKRVALTRAEGAYRKAMKAATVGGYTDTDQAGQALADLHQAKQSSQDAYEQELAQYGYPVNHVEYPEDAEAKAQPQQQQQAQPQQQQQAQKPQQQQAAKKEAAKLPGGQIVGSAVKLRSGQTVTIKKIYADGTFEY